MELRKLMKNKRGQLALDLAQNVFIRFLIIAVISVAIFLALVSLRDANIFSSGTQEQNDTTVIIGNITQATTEFFSNTGTIYSIIIVVVIMLAIFIVVRVVQGAGGGGRRGAAL